MYTLNDIDIFLQDPEAQRQATPQQWKDMRDELNTLLADKPVSLRKYRQRIDELKKQLRAAKAAEQPAKPAKPQPTVISHVTTPGAKYCCRLCKAVLTPTAKAVTEHYEKKHYSEFVRNKAAMTAHPQIFVVKA